jgi:4-hydroxybenzoate polyprenyltransferase
LLKLPDLGLAALPPNLGVKLRLYAQLIRFDKPIGTWLLLWPTLWALAIAAEGSPDGWVLFVFVCGVFLMRSAGCAINDYADREIDLHVSRTRERPLTSGQISAREALAVFAVLGLLAFLLVLTLNELTIWLSFGGIVLAASYPFMKRYHYLPQVHMGAAFGWSVPMAYAAQTGSLPKMAWLLYVATIVWATAYDTMYSMVDRDDDLRVGVKSTAILFGEYDCRVIGLLQLMFLAAMLLVGIDLEFGGYYYLGLLVAAALLGYQQFLIHDRVPEHCFVAFLNNQWVGAAIFFGIMGHYYSSLP